MQLPLRQLGGSRHVRLPLRPRSSDRIVRVRCAIPEPESVVGNLQITYDLSPRIKLTVLGAESLPHLLRRVVGAVDGGFRREQRVCGYFAAGGSLNSTIYPSNFYNGTGINDLAANGVSSADPQSYTPAVTTARRDRRAPPPINVYFNAQIRIYDSSQR